MIIDKRVFFVKKKYVSPKIFYESFELSVNIAACPLIASQQAAYDCSVYDPELLINIFSAEPSCDTTSTSDKDRVCYDVPLEYFSVYWS